MSKPRITVQMLSILAAFLEDPQQEHHGFDLLGPTGLKSGTLYPALIRFRKLGWLESRWEEIDREEEGRPPRRLYRLTGEGERVARELIAEARLEDSLAGRAAGTVQPLPALRERTA